MGGGFDLVQKGLGEEFGFLEKVNSRCHMLGVCALCIVSVLACVCSYINMLLSASLLYLVHAARLLI